MLITADYKNRLLHKTRHRHLSHILVGTGVGCLPEHQSDHDINMSPHCIVMANTRPVNRQFYEFIIKQKLSFKLDWALRNVAICLFFVAEVTMVKDE